MIRISDLVAAIASKHQLNRREAEQFLTTMVDVMNEALRDTKQLRIKGLGTFKVSMVNARESVDVNTGERITIDGRERLSFTPETSMRDLVNKPFAQFETVVVNDGVDFDEIDRKYQHEPDDEDAEPVEPVDVSEPVEPIEPFEPVEVSGPVEPTKPVEIFELVEPAEVSEPDTPEPAPEIAALASLTPSEEITQTEIVNNQTTEPMSTDNLLETEKKVDEYGYPITSEENERLIGIISQKKNVIKWLWTAIVCLLLLLLGGTYFFQQEIKERDNRINHLVAQIQEDQANKHIHSTGRHAATSADRHVKQTVSERERVETEMAEHDRRVKEQQAALASEEQKREEAVKKAQEERRAEEARQAEMMKKEAEKRKAVEAEQKKQQEAKRAELARKAEQAKQEEAARRAEAARKAEQAKQAAAKQQAVKKQTTTGAQNTAQYNQDPRVRTGAYIITGVSETVTVREGQTLASISKAYLGPGMECYVEAINGGIKEVKAGQKLKIPALQMKKGVGKK